MIATNSRAERYFRGWIVRIRTEETGIRLKPQTGAGGRIFRALSFVRILVIFEHIAGSYLTLDLTWSRQESNLLVEKS